MFGSPNRLPPFGIASTAVIFACPSHLPGTVTFDRYLETNPFFSSENVDELDLKQRYAVVDRQRELLSNRNGSDSGSLRLVVAA